MPSALTTKNALLPFIGKSIGATLTPTDDSNLMLAVNQALMELLGQRLAEDRAELVRAPQSVTLEAVTNNSKAITFSGFQSWMLGCSVQIGSTWNRLVKPGSSVSLESDYTGPSGTNVAATVYQDAVNLDVSIEAPTHPVWLNKMYLIQMLPTRDALRRAQLGRAYQGTQPSGQPAYAVMIDSLTLNGTPCSRFLFDAVPEAQYELNYTAQLRAPQISDWNDPTPYFLSGGRDIEILIPVAKKWLMGYPVFIGDNQETMAAYAAAMQKWAGYSNKGSQGGELDMYAC